MYTTNPQVQVEGLLYIPNFITDKEQDLLIKLIDNNKFSTAIHRRQQFYGETYYHTTPDISEIQPMCEVVGEQHYNLNEIRWLIDKFDDLQYKKYNIFSSENAPTQCLVNEYVRNQGIASHFDDSDAFGDIIACVSLNDPIFMTLKLPKIQNNQCQEIVQETKIFLEPKSLLVMRGDARYKWRHGITKAKHFQNPFSGEIVRRDNNYRRLSLTIRKLLEGRKRISNE